ncbi:Hypothetical Protein RradSPS_0833 [Rubrobacter radiotolerans]|uniref:SseB protein N-terminal domain-containing protein n=1 Tax=Rubrobacter radiotolerans TaxID=42256 RepID=A0A023X1Q6_RUBRA|nr:hypothetical protein [Rubrobacter radiotolerans]AHY46116.1 Hypothetical Protein RradSPS_0833 [Rubrobacter radiotolerans]MDX5893526.1 hypothetical protein [Rubrobacter radiotolerans]SMC03922.1 hypothetical protein SAMN00767673_0832 [Rubrobacter radiotolerans DSM 5868]
MLGAGSGRDGAGERGSDKRSYWVIARKDEPRDEVMVLARGPASVMPVFSFSEEADLFLWLGGFGELWRVEEVEGRNLVNLLLDGYADVDEVALDPIPEVQARPVMSLVAVSRARFIEALIGRSFDTPLPDSPV